MPSARKLTAFVICVLVNTNGCKMGRNEIVPSIEKDTWRTQFVEIFDDSLPSKQWIQHDSFLDDGDFSDQGEFFVSRGVRAPKAYSQSFAFGESNWLTAECYTKSDTTPISSMLAISPDPARIPNSALKSTSPSHTDACVIRSTKLSIIHI